MEVKEISLDLIDESKTQPRSFLIREKLEELAASIKLIGVQQPIVVEKKDNRYSLVFGQYRLTASKMAGKKTIPVLVKTLDEKTKQIAALHENLIRESLNPLDVALYLKRLKVEQNLGTVDLAKMFGKSTGWASSHLRLLEIDQEIQAAVEAGQIDLTSGLDLSRIPNKARRMSLLRSAVFSGATQATVRAWVSDEMKHAGIKPTAADKGSETGQTEKPQPVTFACPCCTEKKDQNQAVSIQVCSECLPLVKQILKVYREQENGKS